MASANYEIMTPYSIQDAIQNKEGLQISKILNSNLNYTNTTVRDSKLTQKELQTFISSVVNRAAYFKGSIFANNQYRDEELTVQFSLNSQFDGFNTSKQVKIKDYNGKPGYLELSNIQAKLVRIKNFWQRDIVSCQINVTIDTHFTDMEDFLNTDTMKLRMHLEASDPNQ